MDGFVPALTVPRIPSFIEGLAQHTQSTKKRGGAARWERKRDLEEGRAARACCERCARAPSCSSLTALALSLAALAASRTRPSPCPRRRVQGGVRRHLIRRSAVKSPLCHLPCKTAPAGSRCLARDCRRPLRLAKAPKTSSSGSLKPSPLLPRENRRPEVHRS